MLLGAAQVRTYDALSAKIAKELSSGAQDDKVMNAADLLVLNSAVFNTAWGGGTSQMTTNYKVCHLAEASLPALLTFLTLQSRTRLVWRISPRLILSAADAMQHQEQVRMRVRAPTRPFAAARYFERSP